MRVSAFLQDESGFLGPLFGAIAGKLFGGGIIAKGIGTAVGTILGSRLGAREDRRNAALDYQQQRRLGFTHSEIAGSGGAGAGETGQAVMGNQMTQFEAQRRAQEFEMQERDKDRLVSMRAQDMGLQQSQVNAGAMLGAARLNYDASFHQANTQFDIAAMHNDRAWQQMANDWANNNPQLNIRLKQMTMGVENVQMDLLLMRHKLTPQDMDGISHAEFNRRMNLMMDELAASQGWSNILREGAREVMGTANQVPGTQTPIPQHITPPMPTMGNQVPVYNTTPR